MKTILGLSVSTRMFGLAVVQSGALIDYSVKLYKEPWSPVKMDRILTSLTLAIKNHTITHIALSIPPTHFNQDAPVELLKRITRLGEDQGIPVKPYYQSWLQAICGTDQRLTRKLIMAELVKRYEELDFYYQKELRNKNKYYYKLFEAIAVAILFDEELGKEV